MLNTLTQYYDQSESENGKRDTSCCIHSCYALLKTGQCSDNQM